jgi:hypothetical protein
MEKSKVEQLPEVLYRNEAEFLYGPTVTLLPEKLAFDREMAELAEKMVLEVSTLFEDQDIELDYSEESLEDLDKLVANLWPAPISEEEALEAIVSNWGAYLGRVILEHVGGEWTFRQDLEHASIFFPRTGMEVYPLHKVRKRFMLGAQESFSEFYEAIVRELDEAP